MGQIELGRINRGKSSAILQAAATKSEKIPYLAILATPAIWGVWAAAAGDLLTLQVSIQKTSITGVKFDTADKQIC